MVLLGSCRKDARTSALVHLVPSTVRRMQILSVRSVLLVSNQSTMLSGVILAHGVIPLLRIQRQVLSTLR